MRICFCDDEPSVHLLLEKMVSDWSQKKKIPCKIVHYSNAQELLFQTEETFDFDCMLLDIQMEGIDGIALAKKIRQSDKSVLIAFLTGVREYAPEGYEVQAARYLSNLCSRKNFLSCWIWQQSVPKRKPERAC